MSERWLKQADIPDMEPLITQYSRYINTMLENNIVPTVEIVVGFRVDKDRLLQALTDARAFYEEGYRAAMRSIGWISVEETPVAVAENATTTATVSETERVRCVDCKHLMYSDCYGECGAGHRGIVRPDDTCPDGERRGDDG